MNAREFYNQPKYYSINNHVVDNAKGRSKILNRVNKVALRVENIKRSELDLLKEYSLYIGRDSFVAFELRYSLL